MKQIAFIIFGLFMALSIDAASFDCGKAASKVEKMICDNDELSHLDEEMSVVYKTALKDVRNADIIKQAQKKWIKERNEYAEAIHVKQAYQKQLILLKQPIVTTPAGKLVFERNEHTATLLSNGKVLIVGGRDGKYSYLASAELYDSVSSRFTVVGKLVTHTRSNHFAVLLTDGKVLIAGGEAPYEGLDPVSPLDSAELYDPVSATFRETGGFLPFSNVQSGIGLSGSTTATMLANANVLFARLFMTGDGSAEIYDSITRRFIKTGNFIEARFGHSSTLLTNGNVLFVGGEDNVGMTLTSAEIYDSKMGTFKQTGGLAQARYGHTATLMSNGKVLVVGGYFDDFPLSRAEVYDPVAGRFTDTGPLVKGRTGHTATLLQNGKVLIAGGIGDSGKLSSLELYDPSTGVFSLIGRFIDANQSHIPVLLKNGNVLFIGNSTVELFVLAMIQ